ncbi:MAG: GNAT family N-acetyltransferase [Bacteroidota bacterium]
MSSMTPIDLAASDRLQFRPLLMADAHSLLLIYSDEEAMRFRGSGPMRNLGDACQFVESQQTLDHGTITQRQGVIWRLSGQLIGTIMFRYQPGGEDCEIGYSIGKAYWGQGIGKEIVASMIASLTAQGIFRRLTAVSRRTNIASWKLLEKNGFQRMGEDDTNDCYSYRLELPQTKFSRSN